VGIAAAVVAAAVLTTAAPAYAHHSVLGGSTECFDGDHLVTWSIQAQSVVDLPMTIESATATNNGATYAVTGYSNPVEDETTTFATTIVPSGSTGTVTLHVHSTWPDDVEYTGETSVELEDDCSASSTTTTPAPTTTAPESTTTAAPTTTAPESTTTTIVVEGSTTFPVFTVPPTSPPTTPPGEATTTLVGQGTTTTVVPTPISGSLPRTGGGMGFPIVFGLSLVAGGVMLVLRRRGAWSR
jgi:LPXTG-motif cell wall-anchored protein